jgi:hypothetical protein
MATRRGWPAALAAMAGPHVRRHQQGVVAIEVALSLLWFLMLLFLLIEIFRGMYLWNTVQEMTRRAARAAAITNFSDAAAMAALRQDAVFRGTPGALPLGGAIDDSYVRIDYLSIDSANQLQPVAVLPASPAANMINCTADLHGASCIRFVRARLCLPAGGADCQAVPLMPMLPMPPPLDQLFAQGGIKLPLGTTVSRAESLGYRPGQQP